jgi:DNA polymerase III sliding clamp (beta) subunit (PCNA family)
MRLPKAIAKLVKWADPESSRYALGGVRIGRSAGKCFAEATDGRRLALVEWEDKGPDVDAILNGKELGKALRQAGRKPPYHMDDAVNGVARVNGAEVTTVEGRWPKTEDLFAEERIGSQAASFTAQQLRELARRTAVKIGDTTVLLNVQYLEDLADAMDAADAGVATFKATDDRSQVVAECESVSGANLTAVLMPMAAD